MLFSVNSTKSGVHKQNFCFKGGFTLYLIKSPSEVSGRLTKPTLFVKAINPNFLF